MQNPIYDTITSNHLNYHQKLNALCVEAENTLNVLELPEHLSANALVEVLNLLMDREELEALFS